jgi:dUTP pyrophosphatase|tara:strand:+ start:888 stop:1352 length:465 start_codon:yes stop_codon:yes gene_type:complete
MILQYHMLRGNDYPPVRANPSDAGLDLRWTPSEQVETVMSIKPGESALIPTGCIFGIPHGYMMEIKNKSGIAHKRQLLVGACVVDSGYEGEVFVNLHNIGTETQILSPGDKVAQAVVVPVVHARFVASATPDVYDWYPITISNRGDGALGSTGE